MKANPDYWGGKPGISSLIFQNYANPSAEAFALKNGSIDFAEDLTSRCSTRSRASRASR